MEEKRNFTEMVGDFFQAIADLIDNASNPLYNLIAVTIPFAAPIVIANIVSASLARGHIVDATEAKYLAYVLEGIGIVGLAGLVLAIDAWIKSKNPKTEAMIWLLGVIDTVYFLFLVAVVVLLDAGNPEVTGLQTFARALICLVPLMASGIFGYHRMQNRDKIEKRDEKQEAYVMRQEAREDRMKSKAMKAGFNPFAANTLNQDAPQVRQPKKDWRQLSAEEQHDIVHVLSVNEIMSKYPVSRSTAFSWKSKKA